MSIIFSTLTNQNFIFITISQRQFLIIAYLLYYISFILWVCIYHYLYWSIFIPHFFLTFVLMQNSQCDSPNLSSLHCNIHLVICLLIRPSILSASPIMAFAEVLHARTFFYSKVSLSRNFPLLPPPRPSFPSFRPSHAGHYLSFPRLPPPCRCLPARSQLATGQERSRWASRCGRNRGPVELIPHKRH